MKILVLDDDLERHAVFAAQWAAQDVTPAYSATAAILALDDQVFDLAQLDHDLDQRIGSNAPTGQAVAEHIASMPPERRPRGVVIHSWNPAGAWRMARALRAAGIEAIYRPFGGRFTSAGAWMVAEFEALRSGWRAP